MGGHPATGAARAGRSPAPDGITAAPPWAPAAAGPPGPQPQVLRLPADAISDDGVISLGDGAAVVLVAATTVNIGLRTAAEQAAMVAGYARWLNSLTGPVQVVVSAQRVDLTGHAQRVADAAQTLPDPGAGRRGPGLRAVPARRRASAATRCGAPSPSPAGPPAPHAAAEAMRRAEHTATALAALGSQTRVLDGPTALAVLTAAVDPYAGGDASWPRATPHTPITAPALSEGP